MARTWTGSLLEGQRDASGQVYMRNRYYDPATGQFTQANPIGIAGGMNGYGFAGGDPVNQHDPFGTTCQQKSADHLVCKNVTSGDFGTVADFLGIAEQDIWAENGSCRTFGCNLREATSEERGYVRRRLNSLRTDVEFCRNLRDAGLAMVDRQLGIFENKVYFLPDSLIYGNGPMNARLGGPVMYLYRPKMQWRNGFVIVHEAIHGMINPRRAIQPSYYGDGAITELDLSIDASATFCMQW